MTAIAIIWAVFTVIFLGLALVHFILSRQEIPHFVLGPGPRAAGINGIKTSVEDVAEFVEYFNRYVDAYNRSAKKQNIYAGLGYLAAALTSAVSLYLSVVAQT